MEPLTDAICQAANWLKSSGETVWKLYTRTNLLTMSLVIAT
jgi:hypothetical protein